MLAYPVQQNAKKVPFLQTVQRSNRSSRGLRIGVVSDNLLRIERFMGKAMQASQAAINGMMEIEKKQERFLTYHENV